MSESYLETTVDKFVFRVRKGYWYTHDGLWIGREGTSCKLGMGDYLQQKSGDTTFVKLPKAGTLVQAGDMVGTIKTMKMSFDLVSPFTATVLRTNPELKDHPELVNADPYGAGWLVEFRCTGQPPVLMDALAYFQVMSEEAALEATKLRR